jgi:hypothetical protein
MRFVRTLSLLPAALLGLFLTAAEPAEVKPLLSERGKQLFSDDLTQSPGKEWRIAKGQWEIKDGALFAAEKASDKHNAVLAHNVAFHNAVIQCGVKLDGAKQFSVSINDATGHVCRVTLTPTTLAVKRDDHDKDGKGATLETVPLTLKPGTWHTLLLEMNGKEILAALDGQHVAFGSHDGIDVDKTSVRLVVGGESVSLKDLRMWEATPNKNWEATKAKLIEARKAREASK